MSGPHEHRPYLMIGESRRNAAARALKLGIESWQAKWSHGSQAVSVNAAEDWLQAAKARELSEGCIATAHSNSRSVLMTVEVPARLVATLLGSSSPYGTGGFATDTLESDVLAEVARSLCAELLVRARTLDASIEVLDTKSHRQGRSSLESEASSYWSATVRFGQEAEFRVLLHISLLEVLAPPSVKSVAEPPLQPRRQAITEEVLRLEAWLGDTEVSLQELADLSCGDVIVLQKTLRDPGYLTTDTGARVGDIVLGCSGSCRAVSVVA